MTTPDRSADVLDTLAFLRVNLLPDERDRLDAFLATRPGFGAIRDYVQQRLLHLMAAAGELPVPGPQTEHLT